MLRPDQNRYSLRTRADYVEKFKVIEDEFGDFPIAGLTDRRTRGIFMGWRDRLAAKSQRQADLLLAGVRPHPVVGARSRAGACKSVCTRRAALSRLAGRQDMDRQ
jgi:hypothetical protein